MLVARYIAFIAFGLYRGVWRYAGARDAASIFAAVLVSEAAAFLFIWATVPWNGFPRGIFLIDLLLCTALIGAARFSERGVARGHRRRSSAGGTSGATLIVGAGQSGRSLLRELRETTGERVVGVRRRRPARCGGGGSRACRSSATLDEIGWALGRLEPDAVLVTIPDAPRERLDAVHRGVRPRRRRLPVRPAPDRPRSRGRSSAQRSSERRRRSAATRTRVARRRTLADRAARSASRSRAIYIWLCIDLRRRGVEARDAVALRGRARADAALALDRRDGSRGTARRGRIGPTRSTRTSPRPCG